MRSAILFAFLLTAGCAGNGQRVPSTPDDATPAVLAMTVGDFMDTDADRYRDTTTTTVYVYTASARYPIPMRATGRFDFELQDVKGNRLARWSFDERQTAAALHQMAPGPGYVFDLSLLAAGAERLQTSEGEILCTFTPRAGAPVRTRPSAPVAVGLVSQARGGL